MRKYYIDNLRWMILLILIPYHAAMAWNTWNEPNYISFEGDQLISSFIVFFSPFFMPLLFLLAGMSTKYALKKRTFKEYLAERVKRLIIPSLFGIIVLMPIMTYIGDKFNYSYSGGFFEHYAVFFTKFTDLTGADGGFSVGQFWFLLYLFIISTASIGIIKLQRKFVSVSEKAIPFWLIFVFALPLPLFSEFLSIGGKSLVEYTYFFILGFYVFSDEKVICRLSDALFGLFAAGTTEFTSDTAIMTAISDENGFFEFPKIVYGQYVIREIQAPTGYIFSDEQYPVTIDEDGQAVEIIVENKPITVEIAKQDIYGSELAGAQMQLIDSEENIVDEWISDGTNHVVRELAVGKYTLKEVAAPDGYIIATDISFEMFEDGSVKVENVDATATTEDGHPLVVMVDDTTKVEIRKLDITNDEELAGAVLQIIDENGVVAEEWVSGDKPHYIEAELIAGKTYTLTEIAAPDGYEIASSIEFTVNDDGTVTSVVMYDEPIPDTPDIPTGDTTNRLPGAVMIMTGLALAVILSISKKKKDNDTDKYAAGCPDCIESEE